MWFLSSYQEKRAANQYTFADYFNRFFLLALPYSGFLVVRLRTNETVNTVSPTIPSAIPIEMIMGLSNICPAVNPIPPIAIATLANGNLEEAAMLNSFQCVSAMLFVDFTNFQEGKILNSHSFQK